MMDDRLRFLPILVLVAFAVPLFAQTFERSYDFETLPVGPDWSTNMTFSAAGNRVLGPFNSKNPRYRDKTVLTLKDVPPGIRLELSFDLYLIGSLDSEGPLADTWSLSADGTTLLTVNRFPNAFKDTQYKLPIDNNGSVMLYFRRLPFWVTTQTVAIPASATQKGMLALTFQGTLTGRVTEYWALDKVTLKAVP
jgi:hypothetical protein